mgnify:CR=1 FL=1
MFLIRYIIISLLISNVCAIGSQALVIPPNGEILSNAGTGIAGDIDITLNPAMKKLESPYIQFSLNNWLGDLSGSYTLFKWGKTIPKQIGIQVWNANKIKLYGDSPTDYPIGEFDIHWTSISFGASHNFNSKYIFGFRVQTHYSHLFTESSLGLTFDLGTLIPINKIFSIGSAISNIGYEHSTTTKSTLPIEYGIGSNIKIPLLKSSLLADILFNKSNGQEKRFAFVTNWKYFNINMGKSFAKKRNASALGFSLNYGNWEINYGVYFHENSSIFSDPRSLDVRYYF